VRTNPWLMGVGLAVSLGGCGDVLWKDDGPIAAPSDPSPEPGEDDFSRPPPSRLPVMPVRAAKPPPAISGGTLAVSPDGSFAVAADPDRDAIHLLRLSDQRLTTLSLESGAEPGRVIVDGAGFAHVVLRGSGEVSQIDLQTAKQIRSTRVCALPRGVAFSSVDQSLAVACASGDLVRLAASDHRELSRHFVDTDLRDVLIDGAGQMRVSRYRSAELLDIGAKGQVTGRARPVDRQQLRFKVDLDQQVSMRAALGWRTFTGPDGRSLMLHQQAQQEEVQASAGGYGGGGDCSSISLPGVSTVGVAASGELSFSLGGIALAVDAALSPDSRWLAVAAPGGYLQAQNTVVLYSTVIPDGIPPPAQTFPGEDGGITTPHDAGSSVSPVINCQFPQGSGGFASQVTAVAFTPDGRLLAQSREPARLEIYEIYLSEGPDASGLWPNLALVSTVTLSSKSVADTGHDLFHADVGGGIACASCHGENTDDGLVWTFAGIGPRRTQAMRGGLKGTEPFHWDGDMLTFKHLVDDVLTGRMSGFPVQDAFADSLVSWIDAQPALRLPARNPAAAARGKKLFESTDTGCQSCHSGAATTNNGGFDVGTGGTFQVPALHGLGLRAPYMHTGCAATLKQRFDPACGGGDKHGKTSQLSEKQIDDLTAYLEGL